LEKLWLTEYIAYSNNLVYDASEQTELQAKQRDWNQNLKEKKIVGVKKDVIHFPETIQEIQ